ncbi:MAG: hypothetical protein D6721_01605 [Gammaproteobacteria bacterium]|nr:MAG: hypothetical protein D6721_01605 [Gammaproteobacteria bacterium]
MMQTKTLFITTFFCLALGLFTSAAQALPVTAKLTGVSDAVVIDGVYTGYYDLQVDGTNLLALCDDYETSMSLGDTWQATWLTRADVLAGKGKFNASRGVQAYNEVGYLFSLLDGTNRWKRAQIHLAIWKIMSPTSLDLDDEPLARSYYLEATSGAHDNFDWSGVMRVLTPLPGYHVQEYLAAAPTPANHSVPEPGMLWLLLPGLGLVFRLGRRR